MDGFDPKEGMPQAEDTSREAEPAEAAPGATAAEQEGAAPAAEAAAPEGATSAEQAAPAGQTAQPNYYQDNLAYYRQQQAQQNQGYQQNQAYQQNQGYQQYQSYQQQPPYAQNPYAANTEPPKTGKGFGIAAMICGIASLVLFCTCINIPLAIVAVILAIVCLAKKNGAGKGMAIAGIITSAISMLLFFVFFGLACAGLGSIQPAQISEIYEDFNIDGEWNPYDYEYDFHEDRDYEYDDHDYDYDYDVHDYDADNDRPGRF